MSQSINKMTSFSPPFAALTRLQGVADACVASIDVIFTTHTRSAKEIIQTVGSRFRAHVYQNMMIMKSMKQRALFVRAERLQHLFEVMKMTSMDYFLWI